MLGFWSRSRSLWNQHSTQRANCRRVSLPSFHVPCGYGMLRRVSVVPKINMCPCCLWKPVANFGIMNFRTFSTLDQNDAITMAVARHISWYYVACLNHSVDNLIDIEIVFCLIWYYTLSEDNCNVTDLSIMFVNVLPHIKESQFFKRVWE